MKIDTQCFYLISIDFMWFHLSRSKHTTSTIEQAESEILENFVVEKKWKILLTRFVNQIEWGAYFVILTVSHFLHLFVFLSLSVFITATSIDFDDDYVWEILKCNRPISKHYNQKSDTIKLNSSSRVSAAKQNNELFRIHIQFDLESQFRLLLNILNVNWGLWKINGRGKKEKHWERNFFVRLLFVFVIYQNKLDVTEAQLHFS